MTSLILFLLSQLIMIVRSIFYQKNTAMLNNMIMMKQAQVSANPNQMPFNPMMGMGMNPMMGMGMNPMMGMMGGMMNGMDQNAMMGMNPMIHDAIETLNDLAKTSKEISSLNKDINKSLKDKLNVIIEDKTNKETK